MQLRGVDRGMASASSAQRPIYGFEQPTAGEGRDGGSDSDTDDGGEGAMSAEEAGIKFARELLNLKNLGKLSAKDVCVLSHYAKGAGISGPATKLAFHPTESTGHYQRHLDAVLRIGIEDQLYYIKMPGYDKHELSRAIVDIPAIPPHELLTRELDSTPHAAYNLREQLQDKEWTTAYFNHPVVKGASPGVAVYPLAFYLDGFPFQKRDSAYCFTVCNLITNTRHLVLTLRKSDICKCGCAKWCSFFEIFRFLAWSLDSLAAGHHPEKRHDGTDFGDSERTRHELAGSECMLGAVVYIKGDWQEFTATIGLPTWQDLWHPCFKCWATREQLFTVGDLSAMSSPHEPKLPHDYEEACERCERHVEIEDAHTHAKIASFLFYDKRKKGNKGRCLRAGIPELSLRTGDRLEPSADLPNIGDFEALVSRLPARVVFWRRDNNTVALHRNPIFSVPGVSIQSMAIDVLHTLHLGVFKTYCWATLRGLIAADAWSVGTCTVDVRDQLSVARCRVELLGWYKDRKKITSRRTLV